MVFFNSEMFSVHQSNASSYTLLHWISAETKEYINLTLFEFQIIHKMQSLFLRNMFGPEFIRNLINFRLNI